MKYLVNIIVRALLNKRGPVLILQTRDPGHNEYTSSNHHTVLEKPLLIPLEEEREGYVPNVVYTCGAILHNVDLIIPYGMSDVSTGIATVRVDELISCMRKTKKG